MKWGATQLSEQLTGLAEKTIKKTKTMAPSPETMELRVNKNQWNKRLLRGAWLTNDMDET